MSVGGATSTPPTLEVEIIGEAGGKQQQQQQQQEQQQQQQSLRRGGAVLYSGGVFPPSWGEFGLAIQRSLARPIPLHPALLGFGHLTSWKARLRGILLGRRYKQERSKHAVTARLLHWPLQ